MKRATIALTASVLFLACGLSALAADEVTKESLPTICPKLKVTSEKLDTGVLRVDIIIPDDEKRFDQLIAAWLFVSYASHFDTSCGEVRASADGLDQIGVEA